MKRILLLIPALNAGGAERVMVTLANEWSKNNDVTIIVFNHGYCFYNLNEHVKIKAMNIVLPAKGIHRKLAIPMVELKRLYVILSEIKSGTYDFVLSFCYTTNILASIAAILLKNENIILSERSDPYRYSKFMQKMVNYFYRKPRAIICQNIVVKNYFKNCGFDNKLFVLPNPVCFLDIPENYSEKKKREIVSVGRLITQKNHKLLIEAFDEIKNEFPEYCLKIYGSGPLEDSLNKLINDKGLQKRIFLMGTRKKVMYEVNDADIFVLPSDYEGFPNVLIEAMATGMPVISSDFKTGIAKELIASDSNGYLFEIGNKTQLVEQMRKLLNRRNDFKEIGRENKNVAEKYREDIVASNWMKMIETLIYK